MKLSLLISALLTTGLVAAQEPPKESPTELQIIKDFVPEQRCKNPTKSGDSLEMHYKGMLDDKSVFDESRPRGQTFKFKLGSGQVIKGWDQGLLDMCVGERRILVIPSSLGYGDRGFPPVIPAKATLTFEVECVSINGEKDEL